MKKLYKNMWMQLICALCVFSMVACQEFNIDSQPEGPLKIQVDGMDSYTVPATSSNNITFNISSNTPWEISSDKEWCKPTPAMSAASSLVSKISIAVDSHAGDQARTATLTIKAEGIAENKVITITQVSKEALFVYKPDKVLAVAGGEALTFSVVSNKPWKIIPSHQFLADINPIAGEGRTDGKPEEITITIPKNPEVKRTGTITVKTDFEEQSFDIAQVGGVALQPVVPGDLEFNGTELEKTIEIEASMEWEATIPEIHKSWIVSADKVDNTHLKVKTKFNGSFKERIGEITLSPVTPIAGFVAAPITVKQKIQYTLPEHHSINSNGGMKFEGIALNELISTYSFRKGRIIFNFSDMYLQGENASTSMLLFKIIATNNPVNNASNTGCELARNAIIRMGGPAGELNWQGPVTKNLTAEELNGIRKVELLYEDDPANSGKMKITWLFGDHTVVLPLGQPILDFKVYLKFQKATTNDYCILESIDFDPLN